MVDPDPIVIVIDDDAAFRRSTERLILSVGYKVQTFAAARDFLVNPRPEAPACLLLDVRLPGLSGLDMQRELVTVGIQIPIIFITGHGDIPMAVQAMKAGAVDFLTKPFREQDVLDAIHVALGLDRARRRRQAEIAMLRERLDSLTPRERELLPLIVSGLLNKQMAAEIGTTEGTVKV